jgi:hypothetical protein
MTVVVVKVLNFWFFYKFFKILVKFLKKSWFLGAFLMFLSFCYCL